MAIESLFISCFAQCVGRSFYLYLGCFANEKSFASIGGYDRYYLFWVSTGRQVAAREMQIEGT